MLSLERHWASIQVVVYGFFSLHRHWEKCKDKEQRWAQTVRVKPEIMLKHLRNRLTNKASEKGSTVVNALSIPKMTDTVPSILIKNWYYLLDSLWQQYQEDSSVYILTNARHNLDDLLWGIMGYLRELRSQEVKQELENPWLFAFALNCFRVMLLCICHARLQSKCMQLNWLLLHCKKKKKSFFLKNWLLAFMSVALKVAPFGSYLL